MTDYKELYFKLFNEITDITGIILTKLDGTAKGGIVLAIRNKFDIPIKFVGLGEKLDDLEYFDLENYIYGLFVFHCFRKVFTMDKTQKLNYP